MNFLYSIKKCYEMMVLDKFVFYWVHEEKLRENFIISLSIKILSVIICTVVYGKRTHSFYKNLLKVHENSSLSVFVEESTQHVKSSCFRPKKHEVTYNVIRFLAIKSTRLPPKSTRPIFLELSLLIWVYGENSLFIFYKFFTEGIVYIINSMFFQW